MPLSDRHHAKVKERGFSDEQIAKLAAQNGPPPTLQSLSPEEVQLHWLKQFPAMKGNKGGALLLRFNATTVSLKPDKPEWDEEHQRFKKYLYAYRGNQPKGFNTQPWIPTKPPVIATEGLFDALVSTGIIGIPCAAATAPSHVLRSEFPETVKVYISDADVPFHHAPSLLPVVIGQCKAKGLKLAHLPRNPSANYAYPEDRIPEDCKWGMEEWAKEWKRQGLDPKKQLQQVIDNAREPYEYLRSIFLEYGLAGISYPINNAVLTNGARAIADATQRDDQRLVLRDLLHQVTKAPKKWIDEQIKRRDAARFQEQQEALEERIVLGLEHPPEPSEPTPADPYQIAAGRPVDVHISNLLLDGEVTYGSHQSSLFTYDQATGYWSRMPQPQALQMVQGHVEQVFTVDRDGVRSYPYGTSNQVGSCLASLIIKAANEQLANPKDCIPFIDQTYDCRTAQPIPHSPNHGATYGIEAPLVLTEDCPEAFTTAIDTCFGSEFLPLIRAWIRAIVDPTIPYGRFLLIIGNTGSGKGMLLEFLDSLLPADCRSSLEEPGDICNADKTYQFVLGKRYVSFHDLPARLKPMQLFYKLVENAGVSVRKLNASESETIPLNARFSAAATKLPTLADGNDGLVRRALLLFTKPRLTKPDRKIKDAIVGTTPQHQQLRSEVIGWALAMPKADVFDHLYGKAAEDLTSDALDDLQTNADAVGHFIDEALTTTETVVTNEHWSEIYAAFRVYCDAKGFVGKLNQFHLQGAIRQRLPHLHRKRRKESLQEAIANGRGKDSRRNLPACDWGFGLRDKAFVTGSLGAAPTLITHQLGADGFNTLRDHNPTCPHDSPSQEVAHPELDW